MSLKSLIQIIILILIFIILGSVYFKYFSNNNYIVEETSETIEEEASETVKEEMSETVKDETSETVKEETSKTIEEETSETVKEETSKTIEEETSETVKEETSKTIEEETSETIEEETSETVKDEMSETVKDETSETVKESININGVNENYKTENKSEKKENLNSSNNKLNLKKENKPKKKKKVKNLVKDVEYLTTDKKGNRYRILATSGKSNLNDNSILDLDNVRGVVTSADRSNIYIVSDFAEYNSSNLSSKFYQNVVINYEDKEITCDNFDINMETNMAVAYNNVIVTDPKSVMTAGEMTLDIETKDININPESNKTKVEVITN